jgi:hypothetical protein
MIDPNDHTGQTIWAGSVSGGLWKTTQIDAMPPASVPKDSFAVIVYPNPATSSGTEVQFSLPGDANVSITIYDSAGKLIDEVMKANAPAGTHYLHWDSSSRSGIFYLLFNDGKEKTVRKIVCL